MWTWAPDSLNKCTTRFVVEHGGQRLNWGEVLTLWRDSEAFRNSFNSLLANVPLAAFRWETPPIVAGDQGKAFEFVVVDGPELRVAADPAPFAEHFRHSRGKPVIAFTNLGRDAELIVPCPEGPQADYAHLAAFVRRAPAAQRHFLWAAVARAMARRLGSRPVWLSTAGGGVAWLHVRLDDRPKYYAHEPYRLYRPVAGP
jgi:hypothetical protein